MKTTLALACLLTLGVAAAQPVQQATVQAPAQPAATVATLSLSGPGQQVGISAAELLTMPRQTVQVHNAHTGTTESYQGVELSLLLARIQAPLGAKLHGAALAMYVTAEGSDRYQAIYSLAEVDPSFHSGTVIVADRKDSQPIGDKEGPFKLVNTEDKRPARWVRNLVSLKLIAAQ